MCSEQQAGTFVPCHTDEQLGRLVDALHAIAGGQLVVAYYDRQYGSDEVTGSSDYSVTASSASCASSFFSR